MTKLLAIVMAIISMVGLSQTDTSPQGGCVEDERQAGNLCIHVEGDGYRVLGS